MDTSAPIHELEAVRLRRAELRDTLGALERALAAPTIGRASAWNAHLAGAVDRLAGDFALHVEVTEGPDGLHESILAADPRFGHAISALAHEHGGIATEIADVHRSAASAPDDVEALRERATLLLGRLVRHRQRGADLVYEAFQTDIGGVD